MTTTRKLTSITTALALAAAALGPMATAASAEGGWHGKGRHGGHHAARHDARNWGRGGRHRYAHRRHRRDHTGKYVALGVGALMLGVILSEAARD